MAAFDQSWWDDRTMHFGQIDTQGIVMDGATYTAWVRWRLVDDLLGGPARCHDRPSGRRERQRREARRPSAR